MIDFITVSNNPAKVEILEHSLGMAMSAELPWKLTVIDGTRHDLFTGYNAAAGSTTGEVTAFLHDDVLVLGNAISFKRPMQLLSDPAVGFVGVCGSMRLNTAGTWWGDLPFDQVMSFCRGAVGFPSENSFGMNILAWPGRQAVFGQALVVDGVFLFAILLRESTTMCGKMPGSDSLRNMPGCCRYNCYSKPPIVTMCGP